MLRLIVCLSAGAGIARHAAAEVKVISRFPGTTEFRSLAFSRDGGHVVAWPAENGDESKAVVWKCDGTSRVKHVSLPKSAIYWKLGVSDRGSRIIAYHDDAYLWNCDAEEGDPVLLKSFDGIGKSVALRADGSQLVHVDRFGSQLTDLRTWSVTRLEVSEKAVVSEAVVSDDGGRIVAIVDPGRPRLSELVVFDGTSGRAVHSIIVPHGLRGHVALSRDGKTVMFGGASAGTRSLGGPEFHAWDTDTGKPVSRLRIEDPRASASMFLSADGTQFGVSRRVGEGGNVFRIYNTRSSEVIHELNDDDISDDSGASWMPVATFNAAGDGVVFADASGVIRLWRFAK